MKQGIAVLEITTLGAAIVILDRVDKSARVRLLQAELNDYYGFVLKLQGDAASLEAAAGAARSTAERMQAKCVVSLLNAPSQVAWPAIESPAEYQPLIEQDIVYVPHPETAPQSEATPLMKSQDPYAIGLIETQGFAAVIEAIDTACKAARVEILGKEKLGGGYITILIKGDVAAVTAAIDAGKAKVPPLGTLIAAHVIARPSQAILDLLG